MNVLTDIPLKNYTTMRIGGDARFMTEVHTPDEVANVCRNAKNEGLKIFVLGGGSNVIARDEGFDGLVILNRIPGFEVVADDAASTTLRIGAGENWDVVVSKTVDMNLTGIEAMSAIPGTAGAAPVQNVGAYGQEIADVLLKLSAYDMSEDRFIELNREQCDFSYRNSIFRGAAWGRYFITSITIKLSKTSPQPPFYAALQTYLDNQGIKIYTPSIIRKAVTAIRADKLPDPKLRPNAGSFFKNAIAEAWQLPELLEQYPDMPHYDMPDKQYKIPSGWLIEQAGFKGRLLNGIRVHDKNCLVLINEAATGYADLATARDTIVTSVRDLFRIELHQEPLEIS